MLNALQYYLKKHFMLSHAKRIQYTNLVALIHLHLGQKAEALSTCEQGFAFEPFDGNINHIYGQILLGNGAHQEALFHLKMAWNSNRNNEIFRQSLLDALIKSGHSYPESFLDPCDERMYLYPDKEMGIASNAFDSANVKRHKNRYEFVAQKISGAKNVLDGACGTGYGSEILSYHVEKVTGVDLDATALTYASRHHKRENIQFLQSNLSQLCYENGFFDAIASLETLEHLDDPRPYLNCLVSLLPPHGCFIVSTPISKHGGPSQFNRYHLYEYSLPQFNTLLRHYFSSIEIYVQNLDGNISPLIGNSPETGFLLAVCKHPTKTKLPLLGDFKRFLLVTGFPTYKNISIALIMAKGSDPRDYGVPLGLGYIAAYLEKHAPHLRVKIVMTEAEAIASNPDIVGISSVSSTYGHAITLAEQIREKLGSIPVIVGGPHITRLPISLNPVFTAGVIGEGEQTLLEMASLLVAGESLAHIAGLVIHSSTGPIVTPKRKLLDLDTLPLPWRSTNPLAPDEITLFTSRGCPYRCVFCSSSGETFREFSAEYVVNEIEHILTANPDARSLYFLDDLFIANKKRLKRIVYLLKERGLIGRFTARGFVRANLLTHDTAELLKLMNFKKVRFGAESGSQRILSFLKTASVTVADNQRCIDICNAHDLLVSGSFVFGTPGESKEDILETFDFIDRNRGKMDVEGFYLLMPLPGTPLWDIAKFEGAVSDSMDWSQLNLDMTNPDFNWSSFIYLNQSLPQDEFVSLIRTRLGLKDDPPVHPVAMPGMKLEIGCGDAPRPGYTHVDIRNLPWVDIVAPAWELPLKTGTVAEIYSRHVLEHFMRSDAERAIREWFRVLAPGGGLHLIVPNMEFHIRQWFEGDREWAMAGFWGWQKHEHDVHKWGYSWENLSNLLVDAGFTGVINLTGQPNSQEKDEKHLEIRAFKP